jgi:hypothetical protein
MFWFAGAAWHCQLQQGHDPGIPERKDLEMGTRIMKRSEKERQKMSSL